MDEYYYKSEDLNKFYGCANYENKTVLDVGADWGSTAKFFLGKGAKHVIAVEGHGRLVPKLIRNAEQWKRITVIPYYILSSDQWESLLKDFEIDIVKADCEGCEKHLLNVSIEVLTLVKEYLLEVHGSELLHNLKSLFQKLGYELKLELQHPASSSTRIIYMVRK